MATQPNTCAAYARVSTEDQNCEAQFVELRRYAQLKGWTIVKEYSDVISGSKASRPGLDAMLTSAQAGEVGAIICVKLDRMARSVANFSFLMGRIEKMGVALICTTQGIDTSNSNPCGHLMRDILSAFASFERELIRERTRAGLAVARAAGKKIGRPSALLIPEPERTAVILAWRAEGKRGYRELGVRLGGVSGATAMRAERKVAAAPAAAAAAPEDWTD